MIPGKIGVRLQVDPAGILETVARPDPLIVMHVGPSVRIGCERARQEHWGLSIHGDIDIVPAGVASRWILKQRDRALVVRVSQDLLREAALDLGIDPLDTALLNRFQIRDAKIEHLGWALKAEMDHGFSSGRLYADSIGLALASRLLEGHSLARPNGLAMRSAGLPRVMLRRVLAYIEDNLSEDLSLSAISAVAGLSASHCQRTFHNAVGLSVHRYVIQRRVERAKHLLADKRLPISEVALAVGFSHQSHLACHMQRLLGVSPAGVRKASE